MCILISIKKYFFWTAFLKDCDFDGIPYFSQKKYYIKGVDYLRGVDYFRGVVQKGVNVCKLQEQSNEKITKKSLKVNMITNLLSTGHAAHFFEGPLFHLFQIARKMKKQFSNTRRSVVVC